MLATLEIASPCRGTGQADDAAELLRKSPRLPSSGLAPDAGLKSQNPHQTKSGKLKAKSRNPVDSTFNTTSIRLALLFHQGFDCIVLRQTILDPVISEILVTSRINYSAIEGQSKIKSLLSRSVFCKVLSLQSTINTTSLVKKETCLRQYDIDIC